MSISMLAMMLMVGPGIRMGGMSSAKFVYGRTFYTDMRFGLFEVMADRDCMIKVLIMSSCRR